MGYHHRNDPDLIRDLITDPGTWVVVGLSNNRERPAYGVARWLKFEQGKGLIAVHPDAEPTLGSAAYASIGEIPDQDIKVVDCFVNSEIVGSVIDEVIAHKDRLQIDAVWLQQGVIDEAGAQRARAAGLDVVMDTCPKREYPKLRPAE